jgi:predicted acetyltransferase
MSAASENQEKLRLRMLVAADEVAFRSAVRAFKASDPDWDFAFDFDDGCDFAQYVRRLQAWARGEELPASFVPNTYLVATLGTDIIGRISIRHRLNDFLSRVGGHIGYGVVSAHRRKGHGTEILRQGLIVARARDLRRALLTCDDGNEASAKIIEVNGGVLESIDATPDLPKPKRRYWIEL